MSKVVLLTGLILAASCIFLALPAVAGVEQGDSELTAAIFLISAEESTQVGVVVGLGYFVADPLEIKVVTTAQWFDDDAGDEFLILSLDARALFHFNTQGDVVPYVGAGAGLFFWDSGDDDDTIGEAVGILGVKFFLNDSTTLFTEYNYVFLFDDYGEDDEALHLLTVGLSYFF